MEVHMRRCSGMSFVRTKAEEFTVSAPYVIQVDQKQVRIAGIPNPMSAREDVTRGCGFEDSTNMFGTPPPDGSRADATSCPEENCDGIVVVDVASFDTVTHNLDTPEHVELDEGTLPCLEAAATATNVDVGSSRPVIHDDTPVCPEENADATCIACDVASLHPVIRIIDSPEPVLLEEQTPIITDESLTRTSSRPDDFDDDDVFVYDNPGTTRMVEDATGNPSHELQRLSPPTTGPSTTTAFID